MRSPASPRVGVQRRALAAVLVYVVLVGGLVAISATTLLGLVQNARAISAQSRLLAEISNRKPPLVASAPGARALTDSPFLDGESVTIAGAALQQRVASAIVTAGGTVMSSQIDVDGEEAGNGIVRLLTSFEVSQSGLQKMLYDIEAGMPFLFVVSITVEAPQGSGEQVSAVMRVSMEVEGRWLHAG